MNVCILFANVKQLMVHCGLVTLACMYCTWARIDLDY